MNTLASKMPALRVLQLGLERCGWEILAVDVDVTRDTARIELASGDLLVTFDAQHGRASTTRERRRHVQESIGRRGDRCVVDRIKTDFVGRQRHEGLRSGLRWLADYVADNGTRALSSAETRNLFRPLLAITSSQGTARP